MKLTLQITIDTSTHPDWRQAVAAFLTALGQEPHSASVEQADDSFISLGEVIAFIEHEATDSPPPKIKADAKRFYQSLLSWTISRRKLPLRLVYEGCRQEGRCNEHGHDIFINLLPQWRISVVSLFELTEAQLGRIHPAIAARLRGFIEFLRV